MAAPDVANRVLPGLHPRMSRAAERVLLGRRVDVRTGVSVKEATAEGVQLTDGEFVSTRSLIWCVGVRPDPLVADLGLELSHGRLVVEDDLTIPGHPEAYACGDAAAVPDLTRASEVTAMTAHRAVRQGRLADRNIAASYGTGHRRRYRHHDLGFVVDLGGTAAAANPLGLPISGLPPRRSPAGTTCCRCRPTGSASPWRPCSPARLP